MEVKTLLFPVYVCIVCVFASDVIFRQRQGIWHTKKYLHVVLEVDFAPVVDKCVEINAVLAGLDRSDLRLTHSLRMLGKQVCQITQECTSTSTHGRHARQAALILGVFSSVFGVLDAIAIAKMSAHLNALDRKLLRGLVVIQRHETRLSALERDLLKINVDIAWNHVSMFNKTERLASILDVAIHLATLQGHTAAISRAWAALIDGHLSRDLLDSDQWSKVIQRMREEAAKMGGVLPVSHPQEFLQFPAAFLADGTRWTVGVQVPLLHQVLKFYQYLPSPLLIEHGNQTATAVTLHADDDLLIISADDTLHREISKAELDAACYSRGGRLMCDNLGVFQRRLASSCLGSLFSGLTQAALGRCSMRPLQEDWRITQTSPGTLRIFSKRGRRADTICSNGTRLNHWIVGVSNLTLDEGCSFSSEEFYLERSASTRLDFHLVSQPLWVKGDLEAAWNRTVQQGRVRTDQASRLLQEQQRQYDERSSSRDKDWLSEQLHPVAALGPWTFAVIIAVALALILGLTAALVCVVGRGRRQSGPTPTASQAAAAAAGQQ